MRVIEVLGVTTRGRSSSIREPAGNVLLIIIMMSMRGVINDHNDDIDDDEQPQASTAKVALV